MKHKTGIILLFIGGAFMVIGNAIGSIGVFEFLHQYIIGYVPTEWVSLVNDLMYFLRFVADQGGWTIIGGTVLILIGLMRLGKFIIWVGLTFGMIALIIWIITQVVNFTGISLGATLDTYLAQIYGLFEYNTGFSFVGVTLAVIGKASVKKVKEPKKPKEEEAVVEEETEPSISSDKKYCPSCGVELPITANFCSECGKTFD
jgi:hypothetical protein